MNSSAPLLLRLHITDRTVAGAVLQKRARSSFCCAACPLQHLCTCCLLLYRLARPVVRACCAVTCRSAAAFQLSLLHLRPSCCRGRAAGPTLTASNCCRAFRLGAALASALSRCSTSARKSASSASRSLAPRTAVLARLRPEKSSLNLPSALARWSSARPVHLSLCICPARRLQRCRWLELGYPFVLRL